MTEFWNKSYTYAVIGASSNEEKYGHKVFRSLLKHGYNAIPINPNSDLILGHKTFSSVLDYDGSIDVAIFIIPPSVGINVIKDIKKKGINKVWFQPGSESGDILRFCEENGINFSSNQCLLLIHGE